MRKIILSFALAAWAIPAVAGGSSILMVIKCNHPSHGGGWQIITGPKYYPNFQACWDESKGHQHPTGDYRLQCSTVDR